jgi:hypothetical protein
LLTIFLSLLALVDPDPVRLSVEPKVSFNSPALIRLTTKVVPHPENRSICVFIGGDDYEASSCQDLQGLDAPITIEWPVCAVRRTNTACGYWIPEGAYQAVAILSRTYGVMRVATTFTVGQQPEEEMPDALQSF